MIDDSRRSFIASLAITSLVPTVVLSADVQDDQPMLVLDEHLIGQWKYQSIKKEPLGEKNRGVPLTPWVVGTLSFEKGQQGLKATLDIVEASGLEQMSLTVSAIDR